MSINYNGTSINNIYYNNTLLENVYYNGTRVYQRASYPDYLYLELEEGYSSCTFYFSKVVSTGYTWRTQIPVIEYSFDRENWTTYPYDTDISLTTGQRVYWRGNNNYFSNSTNKYISLRHSSSGSAVKLKCGGNVMSLVDKTCQSTTIPNEHCFYRLFYYLISRSSHYITTAPKLPATTLKNDCYGYMFTGQKYLNTIPYLPALTVGSGEVLSSTTEYSWMFNGCTKICVSDTQTEEYQHPFLYFTSKGASSTANMFTGTGGTFTGDPVENTQYYTSNDVVQ